MKKTLLFTVIVGIFLVPVLAFGSSLTGTIQGFNCVTQGKVCPVGKEDPMAATEKVFVLWDAKGEKFYFVPNVDSKIMARHINQMVMIEGTYNNKFRAIKADNIYIMENMKWRKVWSQDFNDEIYREYLGGSPWSGK